MPMKWTYIFWLLAGLAIVFAQPLIHLLSSPENALNLIPVLYLAMGVGLFFHLKKRLKRAEPKVLMPNGNEIARESNLATQVFKLQGDVLRKFNIEMAAISFLAIPVVVFVTLFVNDFFKKYANAIRLKSVTCAR